MTDLSGITVCLGDLTPNDQFKEDIEEALRIWGNMQQQQVSLYCTENKPKANDMNIPIIRPEWLKRRRRETYVKIGVRHICKNYWQRQLSDRR